LDKRGGNDPHKTRLQAVFGLDEGRFTRHDNPHVIGAEEHRADSLDASTYNLQRIYLAVDIEIIAA
jgi:hypothetical protein